MSDVRRTERSLTPVRLLVALGIAGVLVAMVLDTTFLDPTEQAAAVTPVFSAAAYVDEQFPATADAVTAAAVELPELAAAVDEDPVAAGAAYGVDSGSGKFTVPVAAEGTVAEVDDRFVLLAVEGMPEGADVRIPLTTSLNGAPIRDATGDVSFGDFANQTDYQAVANEYKRKVLDDVIGPLDLDALPGSTVRVVGAWVTGGPENTYIIQPVSIEVVG
jgi:predicted lipoprotein